MGFNFMAVKSGILVVFSTEDIVREHWTKIQTFIVHYVHDLGSLLNFPIILCPHQ